MRTVPRLPPTIPIPRESAACDRRSRFRRRTPWRPGQEEREVGRSYASGRVCKKNKVYSHSVRKSREKGIEWNRQSLGLKHGEEVRRIQNIYDLLLPRQTHHALNVEFFHMIAGFKK